MTSTPIIDSHCHYNLDPFYLNWKQHWQTAQAAGVIGAVVVGTDLESSRKACDIAAQEPRLVAAVGLHPSTFTAQSEQVSPEILLRMLDELRQSGPVSALGETGLDYFRLTGSTSELEKIKHVQKTAFTAHLVVAADQKLPVLVHVRDQGEAAYADVLELIKPYANSFPIILHCFSGPDWYLDKALEFGCYISFAGNITYPTAAVLRTHCKKVPPQQLLVETDAPFLPPQAHRGQTCEPRFIVETVQYLRDELGISPSELVNTARSIFTTIPANI